MRHILKYLKPFSKRLTFNMILKVFATVIELALPRILSYILNEIISPLEGQADVDTKAKALEIALYAVLMIVCAALGVAGSIKANRVSAEIAKDAAGMIRHDLFDRTVRLTPAQTDAFTVPSLESRITSDTYNIHNFINSMQRMGVRAPDHARGRSTRRSRPPSTA